MTASSKADLVQQRKTKSSTMRQQYYGYKHKQDKELPDVPETFIIYIDNMKNNCAIHTFCHSKKPTRINFCVLCIFLKIDSPPKPLKVLTFHVIHCSHPSYKHFDCILVKYSKLQYYCKYGKFLMWNGCLAINIHEKQIKCKMDTELNSRYFPLCYIICRNNV